MNITILEEDKEKLKLRISGATLTFPFLLAKAIREEGGDAAANQEHPFLAEPELLVIGKNPRNLIRNACERIIAQCDEFKSEFNKQVE
ncbi:MAG: hypothetical protein QXF15_00790 [Candidatus Aenigmatarchaeota archaeon]|nr:hypothetical protein [Candidatus Aenigmarchaeota archaeon]